MSKGGVLCACAVSMTLMSSVCAEASVLRGRNASYAGDTLELRRYLEGITNMSEVVARSVVGADGSFSFETKNSEIMRCFLPGDAQRGHIYISAGREYEIDIPDKRHRTINQKLQPYFSPDEYYIKIKNIDKDEANYKLMEFEDAYDYYSLKTLASGRDADTLRKSVGDLRSIFSDFDGEEYLRTYRECRIVLLESQFTEADSIPAICNKLSAIGAKVDNPAFWDAFNAIFFDFIMNTAGTEDFYIFRRIVENGTAKMLMTHLKEKYRITDVALRELAAIKIVADLASSKYFETSKLVWLMEDMMYYMTTAERKKILTEAAYNVSFGLPGSQAPELSMIDHLGKEHTMKEYEGKHIYLNFCNSRLTKTEKDLKILQRFAQTFKDALVVINVFLYDDEARVKRVAELFGKDMMCLYTKDGDEVRRIFNMRNVPSYYLLDGSGKFVLSKNAEPGDELRYLMLQLFDVK